MITKEFLALRLMKLGEMEKKLLSNLNAVIGAKNEVMDLMGYLDTIKNPPIKPEPMIKPEPEPEIPAEAQENGRDTTWAVI